MAVLQLGDEREQLEVRLCRDDDFTATIQLQAGPRNPDGLAEGAPIDWPAGTRVWLWVRGHAAAVAQQWEATVDGPYLRWDVDRALIDPIPARATARLIVDYGDGRGNFIWAKGQVVWE